jgi:hypothetical protein
VLEVYRCEPLSIRLSRCTHYIAQRSSLRAAWVIRDTNSTLRSRESEVSDAIGEVIREGDRAMMRKHMKSVEQVLRRNGCATLKCSLSTSCDLLLKQLIRLQVSFQCLLAVLSDDFITL